MREALSALCHSRARGDFCQAVTLTARYQGALCRLWRRPCHARQSATPVRHDSSATEYHNAYAVDPTVYAATYTASTGTSLMGQVKTPLGQRVYSAMKRIREEILNTVAPLMPSAQYTIHPRWTHLSGTNACVRVFLAL